RSLGVVARTRMIHNVIFLGDTRVDTAVLFAEGMALAAGLEGPSPRVTLLWEYGGARVTAGQMHEGLAHLSESVALADRSGDPFLGFMTRAPYGVYLGAAGRLQESVTVVTEAEALCGATRTSVPRSRGSARTASGWRPAVSRWPGWDTP